MNGAPLKIERFTIGSRLMPVTKIEKRALGAWWLPPSFSWIQFTDNNIILYIGAHKPRQEGTKHMEEVKRDPRAYEPKMDITVLTDSRSESFPVYVSDLSSIIAGINLIDAAINGTTRTITERSIALSNLWKNRSDLPLNPYIEFDPNKTKFNEIATIAQKHGPSMLRYDLPELLKRQKDILWWKGAILEMRRPHREKRNTFYHDIILTGKDVKRNEIVLGFRKSGPGVDYSRIVPLHQNGTYLLAAIRYIIDNKPSKYPVISATRMERLVQESVDRIKTNDLVFTDIRVPVDELVRSVG